MNAAKIRLSPTEKELVSDTRFILTKNDILQKTKELLGLLQVKYHDHLQQLVPLLPAAITGTSPKISRGENYKGLPWLMLDYPRSFTRSSVFAIRTMFWWGNFFSITLHLSGEHKKKYEKKLIAAYPLLKKKGFSFNAGPEEWEHHFEKDNYRSLSRITKNEFEKRVRQAPFLKLAGNIPLKQWDESSGVLYRYFQLLVSILTG